MAILLFKAYFQLLPVARASLPAVPAGPINPHSFRHLLQMSLSVAKVEPQFLAGLPNRFEVSRRKERLLEKKARFDGNAFYAALDGERQARECTWRRVAQESGVSASTLTRIAQGKRPDVDSLAALSAWSGLNVDRFVRSNTSKKQPEPLAMISSFLRSDPRLNEEAAAALDQMVKAAYKSMTGPGRTA